jgi:hypothetical protein
MSQGGLQKATALSFFSFGRVTPSALLGPGQWVDRLLYVIEEPEP